MMNTHLHSQRMTRSRGENEAQNFILIRSQSHVTQFDVKAKR